MLFPFVSTPGSRPEEASEALECAQELDVRQAVGCVRTPTLDRPPQAARIAAFGGYVEEPAQVCVDQNWSDENSDAEVHQSRRQSQNWHQLSLWIYG